MSERAPANEGKENNAELDSTDAGGKTAKNDKGKKAHKKRKKRNPLICFTGGMITHPAPAEL